MFDWYMNESMANIWLLVSGIGYAWGVHRVPWIIATVDNAHVYLAL
jgi:hypothetical protein